MSERTAQTSLGIGVALFGLSLTDWGLIATVFAGFMGGIASLAAAIYYIYKIKKGETH
jgi:hypothetical protein